MIIDLPNAAQSSATEQITAVPSGGNHGEVHAYRGAGAWQPAGRPEGRSVEYSLQGGDEMLIVNRVLIDRHGNQRGTFVLRGTFVQVFSPSDALMAFQATNTITGEGLDQYPRRDPIQ